MRLIKLVILDILSRLLMVFIGLLIAVIGLFSPDMVINATASAFRENNWINGIPPSGSKGSK